MADGDDGVGHVLGVEDLGEGIGLLQVVVFGGVGGLGAAAEAEDVGDDHWEVEFL